MHSYYNILSFKLDFLYDENLFTQSQIVYLKDKLIHFIEDKFYLRNEPNFVFKKVKEELDYLLFISNINNISDKSFNILTKEIYNVYIEKE